LSGIFLAIIADFKNLLEVVKLLVAGDTPVVFVGGVALYLYLNEINYDGISRQTVDIDANIISDSLTINSFLELVNSRIVEIDSLLIAKIKENPREARAVGITIYNDYSKHIYLRMDISNTPVLTIKEYVLDNCVIKAITPLELLSNKLSIMSTNSILRRAKDLFDILVLSRCLQFKFIDVFELQKLSTRKKDYLKTSYPAIVPWKKIIISFKIYLENPISSHCIIIYTILFFPFF
jgi:hypothetical protein